MDGVLGILRRSYRVGHVVTLIERIHQRDQLAKQLRQADQELAAEIRQFSFDRGYRVPLRVEAVKQMMEGAA